MKQTYLLILLVLLLPLHNTLAFVPSEEFGAQTSCAVTTLLKTGSKGTEVACLQGKLGVLSDGKFGPLTKTAVINFQLSKGLVPDGVVGPMTRAAFHNILVNKGVLPTGCTETTKYNPMTGAPCHIESSFPTSYPKTVIQQTVVVPEQKAESSIKKVEAKVPANLTNLDKFINTVVAFRKKEGDNEKKIETIATTLREEVLESDMDYNKEFEKMLKSEAALSSFSPTFFKRIFIQTLARITPKAHAISGVPFGGWLIFPFYCVASSNWIITLTPFPPSYAYVLSYTPFTQGFASYNTPYTRALLGEYSPVGVCSYGYVNIPTAGVITPMTGSSPS